MILIVSGDDEARRKSELLETVESRTCEEFLVGEIGLEQALVVADSALDGKTLTVERMPGDPTTLGRDRFCVPRPAGRYVLLEGSMAGASWCRLIARNRKTYPKRPKQEAQDPVAALWNVISFATPQQEARALETALELIELRRPDLALEVCAKASPERRVLASWTRTMALAAQRDATVGTEAVVLAEAWLQPADSPASTNQVLTRSDVLRVLDAALAVCAQSTVEMVRAQVVAAPEPATFVPDGDVF